MSVEFDVCRDLSEPDGYYTTITALWIRIKVRVRVRVLVRVRARVKLRLILRIGIV
jgi:hypothetical protein